MAAEAAGAHLKAEAAALLDDSEEARLAYLEQEGPSVAYTRATEILERLEAMFRAPRRPRMPNLLLVGESNNGKSTLLAEFKRRHPAVDNLQGEGVDVPVLTVEVPPMPDENRLYMSILDELFAPYRALDHVARKRALVVDLLPRLKVMMLMLDDIHNMLASSTAKQHGFLNTLRHLGNVLQIPIVAAGIPEAVRAIHTDAQLANRFRPAPLPRWTLDVEFLRLLKSLEERIPLKKPSDLYRNQKLATKILALSEGILGEIVTVLKEAAVFAIVSGREQIDAKALAMIDYCPPSERRRRAERMK